MIYNYQTIQMTDVVTKSKREQHLYIEFYQFSAQWPGLILGARRMFIEW